MKIVKIFFAISLGIIMVTAGVNHFTKPDFYLPFVPDFLPLKEFIIYLSGALEFVLGIGVFIPYFRKHAAFGVFALMIIFFPIHVMDYFRVNPAIGSHTAALARIPLQFLFMAWAAWIAYPYVYCLKTKG